MANEAKFYNGIDLQSQKGINALDPTNAQDLATKQYVDAHASGADTATMVASEAISAGMYVNIAVDGKIRKAQAIRDREAHGYILVGVAALGTATVFFEGTNSGVTGQTPGVVFLSDTAGMGQSFRPVGLGKIVQRIGFATSATAVNFQSLIPVGLRTA